MNCATLTQATGLPSRRAQDCWKRCVVRDRGTAPFPQGTSAGISKVRVVDGDSIEAMFDGRFVRVRLYGIDAPELRQQGGPEAAETLKGLVRRNGDLNMEVMAFDRYDRVVGLIYPRSSHRRNSLNLRMVREGQAYAYTRFGGAELGLRTAEQDAKAGRRGIWRSGSEGGERPWDYRNRSRDAGLSSIPVTVVIIVLALLAIVVGKIFGWI